MQSKRVLDTKDRFAIEKISTKTAGSLLIQVDLGTRNQGTDESAPVGTRIYFINNKIVNRRGATLTSGPAARTPSRYVSES